jgi:hypothetical protein
VAQWLVLRKIAKRAVWWIVIVMATAELSLIHSRARLLLFARWVLPGVVLAGLLASSGFFERAARQEMK